MKRLVAFMAFLDVMYIGLLWGNIYYIKWEMPEAVSLFFAAALFAGNALVIKKGKKKAPKVVLSAVTFLVMGLGVLMTYCNPWWNSLTFQQGAGRSLAGESVLTYRQAMRDVAFARKQLAKVHPKAKGGLPERVQAGFDEVERALKEQEEITVYFLERQLRAVVSRLEDGHTTVYDYFPQYRYLRCVHTHNTAGDRLVGVNGVELRELYERNKQYFSFDSGADDYGYRFFVNSITRPDGLALLDIDIDAGVSYTFERPDGSTVDEVAYQADFISYEEYQEYHQIQTEPYCFVEYTIDEETDLAVLTLKECTNNAKYKEQLRKMFGEVKEKGIRNVAVDLRKNGGGDSSVANEFIKYLPAQTYRDWAADYRYGFLEMHYPARKNRNKRQEELLFDGNVYVLTSQMTYSSAMDFAMYIKDNGLGEVVGEASLNDPYGYGQPPTFSLPESGLRLQISMAKWYRIDQECDERLIEPDVTCPADEALEVLKRKLCPERAGLQRMEKEG